MVPFVFKAALIFEFFKSIHSQYSYEEINQSYYEHYYITPLKHPMCHNLSFTECLQRLNSDGTAPILSSKQIPVFHHLDEILSHQNSHSHITLTHFRNINFKPSFHPIIIRNIEILCTVEAPCI